MFAYLFSSFKDIYETGHELDGEINDILKYYNTSYYIDRLMDGWMDGWNDTSRSITIIIIIIIVRSNKNNE
jgi:hypothetical protein